MSAGAGPSSALRGVQHDRQGGAIELVAQLTPAGRQAQGRGKRVEFHRDAVDVEPLEVETRSGRIRNR